MNCIIEGGYDISFGIIFHLSVHCKLSRAMTMQRLGNSCNQNLFLSLPYGEKRQTTISHICIKVAIQVVVI